MVNPLIFCDFFIRIFWVPRFTAVGKGGGEQQGGLMLTTLFFRAWWSRSWFFRIVNVRHCVRRIPSLSMAFGTFWVDDRSILNLWCIPLFAVRLQHLSIRQVSPYREWYGPPVGEVSDWLSSCAARCCQTEQVTWRKIWPLADSRDFLEWPSCWRRRCSDRSCSQQAMMISVAAGHEHAEVGCFVFPWARTKDENAHVPKGRGAETSLLRTSGWSARCMWFPIKAPEWYAWRSSLCWDRNVSQEENWTDHSWRSVSSVLVLPGQFLLLTLLLHYCGYSTATVSK